MRPYLRTFMIFIMFIIPGLILSTGSGCSGAKDTLKQIPPSLADVSSTHHYKNKIAVFLSYSPATAVGRQIGEHYLQTLIKAIRNESTMLNLVGQKDTEFPESFKKMGQVESSSEAMMAASATARLSGYQGWLNVRVEGMRPEAKPTGFFWFRKVRHFIIFELNLTIYDAITGAKMMDSVVESSTQVSESEYNAFCGDKADDVKTLKGVIADIAADQGEKAAETLRDQPWRITVGQVASNRVLLPAGSGVGLRVGDRLTVFEGQHMLQNQEGMPFWVPGFQIGQIEIVHVTRQKAEAKVLTASGDKKIQAGDFAAATVFK